MLSSIFASMWLSGKWIPAGYNPTPAPTAPGDVLQDIFGQPLAVGNVVKIVGTITAVANLDAHFQDITFVPQFPQSTLVSNTQGVPPQQQPIVSIRCHPLQLVKIPAGGWL